MSAIDIEAGVRGKPNVQVDVDVKPKSPLQTLEKYVSIQDEAGFGNAAATSSGAMAIGAGASTRGGSSYGGPISIGVSAATNGGGSIAIGVFTAAYLRGTAVGYQADAKSDGTTAVGAYAKSEGSASVAIGFTSSTIGSHAAAFGPYSHSDAFYSLALGVASSAVHDRAVALGSNSRTDQDNTISVGSVEFRRAIRFVRNAELSSSSHEAVTGQQLFATNEQVDANEVAIARNAENISANAAGIRNLNQQIGNGTLGLLKQDPSSRALTVGGQTDGDLVKLNGSKGARRLAGLVPGQDGSDAATVGQLDTLRKDPQVTRYDNTERTRLTFNSGGAATRLGNVAEGQAASDAATVGQVNAVRKDPQLARYDDAARTKLTFNSGGEATRLGNVAEGVDASDAVTKAQLDLVNHAVGNLLTLIGHQNLTNVRYDSDKEAVPLDGARITGLVDGTEAQDAVSKGQLDSAIIPLHETLADTVVYSDDTHTHVLLNPGNDAARLGNVAAGTADGDAVNFGQLSPVLEKARFIEATGTAGAEAPGQLATAAGSGAQAVGNSSVAVGVNATAQGVFDVAIGCKAVATYELAGEFKYSGVALGNSSETASSGVALGQSAKGLARGSVAIGGAAEVQEKYAISVGQQAQAVAEGAVAFGKRAKGNAENAVALGSNSVADKADTVSVGNDKLKRRVTNLAPGVEEWDAATFGQIRRSEQDAVFRHRELEQKCEALEGLLRQHEQRSSALEERIRLLSERLDVG